MENIFTRKEHESLKHQKGFRSKYLEIKNSIQDIEKQIEALNDPRVRKSIVGEHYDIKTKKAELASKIEKLMCKVLNAGQIRLLNIKLRNSILQTQEESGLFSMNESDISKGAFDIGKVFECIICR